MEQVDRLRLRWSRLAEAVPRTGPALIALAALVLGAVVLPQCFPARARADVVEYMVPTPEMPDVKVRIWRAAGGGKKSLILLDDLRASPERSGWEQNTDAENIALGGINIVEPVGGQASFYTDWDSRSNLNGQPYRYLWETFLAVTLPKFLASIGLDSRHNAIAGASMGGGAALILAANHRELFAFAGSFSGFVNVSAPGARESIRVVMLGDGGYNSDSMWGPPWSPRWMQNDATVRAEDLRGLPMYISAGGGGTTSFDAANPGLDTLNAQMLEGMANSEARALQRRFGELDIRATFDFTEEGTHTWPYWKAELWKALPKIRLALGV
ncbi:alpha/beta hydrolase-fold protein [Segniliparus rugosus]|uniref:alpha/beta hydrolase n=1 Tax=Segniliparus rugosus TaxID=286804 RepID=UPI0001F03614